MNNLLKLSAAAGLLAVTVAGCNGGSNGSNGGIGGGGGGTGVTTYTQQERLARPVVNEVLATFGDGEHHKNNIIPPAGDQAELTPDIERFVVREVAKRSQATSDAIKLVLVPDVMVADLTRSGPASYLGVETKGFTGGTFGGRALRDDVVDLTLGVIFGTTVAALGLAPADGKQIPSLTSDNVGPGAHQYLNTFPYLGNPH